MTEATRHTLDAAFIGQRQPLIRCLLRLVGSLAVAEDLVQDTYLRVAAALRDRSGSQPVQHIEPFLYQTARNLALDHLRAQRRHNQVVIGNFSSDDLNYIPAVTPSPETQIRDKELLGHLDSALAGLSKRQQRIVVLSRLQGWEQAEIARHLGVSLSTVQKDLKIALAACLAAFTRAGGS